MKEIVQSTEKNIVAIDEITDSSIVGILWSNENKSAVIRLTEGFGGLGNESATPNLLNVWIANNKQEYVRRALRQNPYVKAYTFNTTKELFKWFSE